MTTQACTENVLDALEHEIVCWCSRVSKADILAARRQGATTLEDIRRATGACTLGHCRELSPRGRCCSKEIGLLLEAAVNDKECAP